jgi:F-type H+-transporting ATPase subunit c
MKNVNKVLFVMLALLTTVAAQAEEVVAGAAEGSARGMTAMAAAIAIGLAVLGGTTGQAKTAAAYLEGISRNPSAQDKMFVPMILGLALIESLVLFAFVIAFLVK